MVVTNSRVDFKLLRDECVRFGIRGGHLLCADSEVVAERAQESIGDLPRRHGVLIALQIVSANRYSQRAAWQLVDVAVSTDMGEAQLRRVARVQRRGDETVHGATVLLSDQERSGRAVQCRL